MFEFDKQEVEKIQRKTIAVSLVLLATLATAIGALAFAADTNSTNSTNTTTSTTPPEQFLEPSVTQFSRGMITNMQGFGGGCRHGGPRGFMGGMTNIEVSSEYTAKINAILTNDSDVQNLISQGYNVTAINPLVKNVVEGDGTLTTKATTAIVLLQNGTSGYATISVDVTNAKVTQMVTITRTVIDKSSS